MGKVSGFIIFKRNRYHERYITSDYKFKMSCERNIVVRYFASVVSCGVIDINDSNTITNKIFVISF